jgi:hypothetical protein
MMRKMEEMNEDGENEWKDRLLRHTLIYGMIFEKGVKDLLRTSWGSVWGHRLIVLYRWGSLRQMAILSAGGCGRSTPAIVAVTQGSEILVLFDLNGRSALLP